jgi:spore germination cell wall hydrolase CwlJ-like protein
MRADDRPIFDALNDLQAMALTIYGEARGEFLKFGRPALAGVGYAIKNRIDHPTWWGKGVKGVCYHPVQFSCYLSVSAAAGYRELLKIAKDWTNALHNDHMLFLCLEIADKILTGKEPNPVDHATSYCNPALCTPAWREDKVFVVTIGRHDFYKEG